MHKYLRGCRMLTPIIILNKCGYRYNFTNCASSLSNDERRMARFLFCSYKSLPVDPN